MDFNLSREHQLVRKMMAEFTENEVKPIAAEIDKNHRFPSESIPKMAELGMFGLNTSEDLEGAGGDYLSYILAVEELAKYDAGVSITLSATVSLCANPIWQFGTEEQKEKFLVPLVEGTKLGAFGLTEPNAGTDASGQQTVAVKNDERHVHPERLQDFHHQRRPC